MTKNKVKTKPFPQDAGTGRIVKLSYAKTHKKTTFVQEVPIRRPKTK